MTKLTSDNVAKIQGLIIIFFPFLMAPTNDTSHVWTVNYFNGKRKIVVEVI